MVHVNTPAESLFSQWQNIILAQGKNPFYISHTQAHSSLQGPLAVGNDCIDRALVREALVSHPVTLA